MNAILKGEKVVVNWFISWISLFKVYKHNYVLKIIMLNVFEVKVSSTEYIELIKSIV